MASTQVNETLIGRDVERLFGEISAKRGDLCTNPVTGGEFVYGFDPIRLQKKIAHHEIFARTESVFTPEQLAEMRRRFPPRKLEGLKCFCWLPPRRRNQAKEKRRAA